MDEVDSLEQEIKARKENKKKRKDRAEKLALAFMLAAVPLTIFNTLSGIKGEAIAKQPDSEAKYEKQQQDIKQKKAELEKANEEYNREYQDQELLDENGKKYTLHRNEDGTETARYEDGQEVTFKQENDGHLNVVSGNPTLIQPVAPSYFYFYGFNSPYGAYVAATHTYVPSSTPQPMSSTERSDALKKYTPSGGKMQSPISYRRSSSSSGSSTGGSSHVGSSSSSSSKSSSSSVSSGSKGGFGSAGARSAAS